MAALRSPSAQRASARSFSSTSLSVGPSRQWRGKSRAKRGRSSHAGPIVAFLLIASFGILFAGCSKSSSLIKGPDDAKEGDEFSITQEDIARFHELSQSSAGSGTTMTGSGKEAIPTLTLEEGKAVTGTSSIVLDLSMVKKFNELRTPVEAGGQNLFQVINNAFVNVREKAAANAASVGQLNLGDRVPVKEFLNAAWARVQLPSGKEGFIAARYLAKVTTDDLLAQEKKAYEGLFFVDFAFLNVREKPDSKSVKLGELPGQAFVKPQMLDAQWAKVVFQGKDGYVSRQYLSPFLPQFIVRRNSFTMPILHYDLADEEMSTVLVQQALKLKKDGVRLLTFRDLSAAVQNDSALPASSAIIAVTGITSENIRSLTDALYGNGIPATLFLQTNTISLSGITEKMITTLLADGFDLQSAGHTGDDLRSLTNAQVTLELQQSRKILEDLTHKSVFAIAYPQGGVNDRLMEKAAAAGYLFGLGAAPDSTFTRDQFLRLPSFTVTSSMSVEDIENVVKH